MTSCQDIGANRIKWLGVTEAMVAAGVLELGSYGEAISAQEGCDIVSRVYASMEAQRRREFQGKRSTLLKRGKGVRRSAKVRQDATSAAE